MTSEPEEERPISKLGEIHRESPAVCLNVLFREALQKNWVGEAGKAILKFPFKMFLTNVDRSVNSHRFVFCD